MVVARRGQAEDPPSPPPRRLRPFLGFTHLPERALAVARRVLDDDEGFRHTVRNATTEELVGRPSWLFLDRPPGWEEELLELSANAEQAAGAAEQARQESAAARRSERADEARRQAEERSERLVGALHEVKEQLAAERKSRSRSESEAGRLRRRVAELTARAEGAEARVADLESTLAGAPEVGESSSGVDHSDQATSVAADLDHRALAEAVATGVAAVHVLAEALQAVEEGLAPLLDPGPPSSPRTGVGERQEGGGSSPPPTRRPIELPPAVLDDSSEAAELLVRADGVLVLVDGYNITKLARPELTLPEQRQWLVDAAVELSARTAARLEVVFDGTGDQGSAPADLRRRTGVQVRFSPSDVEADDVLLDLVDHMAPVPTVVASDDRRVQEGARRLGANVITAAQLLSVLRRLLPG